MSIFIALPKLTLAAPSKLVIDELRISGENTNDEYVVIANFGETPINLNGYRLVKRAKSTTDYKLVDDFGDFVLNPNQKVVAAHAKYVGSRDFTFVTGSSNTLADNNSVFLLAPDKSTVDMVGYGDAIYFEGSLMSAPSVGEVYARVGGLDTDNNGADFVLQKAVLDLDANAARLVISELVPNPESGGEWFELYNPTNLEISLRNLKICDVLASTHCYIFEDNDTIGANSYKTYSQTITKITMNNSGDWLELYDSNDSFLSDSGGNYGVADKGVSLALFGSEYQWTASPTAGAANVYTDTTEVETETKTTAKNTKSKVKLASAKTTVKTTATDAEEAETENNEAVKGAKSAQAESGKALISKKNIGWALIALAILLLLGYTLWYFREYAKNIYYKIRPRDDSARF